MLRSACRLSSLPLRAQQRRFAVTALAKGNNSDASTSLVENIEHDAGRLLRVVRRRVGDRKRLMDELTEDMSHPDDIARLRQIKELEPLSTAWEKWESTLESLRETKALMSDSDPAMRELAVDEYNTLADDLSNHVNEVFPSLLVPPSTTADMSALIELKSGVGGSEASLFLSDLMRVYLRFANMRKWDSSIVAKNETDNGGIKDAILEIKGEGAYDSLRWESGVHRVQRVPATETSGRTHTSTVAAVVLPLSENEESERSELFSMDEVKIEVMRARGAGGQHVNKTESAVRLTHIPTGITVSMQDERSQHQNRRRAFQVLTARLMDIKIQKDMEDRRATRKNLVKGADRSEKIRTYNFAQDRVTDHRIGLTLKNLRSVMEGDGLEAFVEALQKEHAESELESMFEES